jgi:RND family efflux transporter MFP subunit
MTRRVLLQLLTLLLLVGVLGACEKAEQDKQDQGKKKQQLVTTTQVTKGIQQQQIERSGNLRVRRIIHVHNLEEGQIKEIPWYEGDEVSQGEMLVRLDDELLLTAQRKAAAQLDEAEKNLQRLERLIKTNAISEETLIAARTGVAVSKADIDELSVRLQRTKIHADFDGLITERLVEPGDFAEKNRHLLTIIDPQSLVIEVSLSQLLLPSLQKGDAVEVQIDALGQQWHPAKIIRIHPTIDPLTGQGTVEVGFDTLPAGIKTGQRATLRLAITSDEILLIPYSAQQQNRERNWVYLIKEGKAVEKDIVPGEYWPDGIAVIDGVEDGDEIITRGFLGLKNGAEVTIVKAQDDSQQ